MTKNTPSLILVLGGARSGKSTYAEKLAADFGDEVLYIATAEARDDEMTARIAAHKAARPATWITLEAPLSVANALNDYAQASPAPRAILLDCVTLLTSNILLSMENKPYPEIEVALMDELRQLLAVREKITPVPTLILVSNEVGMGVVPAYQLGRQYQDLLGRANQFLAKRAERVVFMVAGLPMNLKS